MSKLADVCIAYLFLILLMRERTPKLIPSVITVEIADFHAHTWPRQGNPQFSRKGEFSGTGGKEAEFR